MKSTQSRLLCLGLIGVAVSFVGIVAFTRPAGAVPPPPPQTYDLNMTVTPTGGGHVAPNPNPAGGTFDGTPNSWVETYVSGTSVALSAVPRVGHIFDHWEGDLTGIANYTYLGMNSPKNVTAVFCPVDPGPPPEITLTHVTLAPAADGTTSCSRLTVGAGEIVRVIIHSFVDEDLKCGDAVLDGLETEGRWETRVNGILLSAEDTDAPYIDKSLDRTGECEIRYYTRDSHNGRGTSDDPESVSASDGSTWSASESVIYNVISPQGVQFSRVVGHGFGPHLVETDWASASFIGICEVVHDQLMPTSVSFSRCRLKEEFWPSGVLTLGPFPNELEVKATSEGDSPVSSENKFPDLLNDSHLSKFVLVSSKPPHELIDFTDSVPAENEKWSLLWKVQHEGYDGDFEEFKDDMTITSHYSCDGVGRHSGYLEEDEEFPEQGPWKYR